MIRIKSVFLFCFLCLAGAFKIYSQTPYYLDRESSLALQTVPIYDGVDSFTERIEKIRREENREPLGLVLTGGSARAFCHIGVLKALEENGIAPDFIIANSMGAIIGSLYAYGFSPERIEEIISRITLSKYFEPVVPVHGGIISVRKYEALVNMLLGDGSHDLKDSAIPVLLLSEDLYSKRQIWHAQGDIATVMDAAFAISLLMEPVDYELSDGTKVRLVDSGSIDIVGLKVARNFSSNLIVSSAFYDVKVDLNNPIVILNRTFSIGKERVAVSDLLDFNPVLIRNDVEHFSFMDFQKMTEITQVGYDSAYSVMPYLLDVPHGFEIDLERRKVTSDMADSFLKKVYDGEPMKTSRPYLGLKLWPEFGVTDFPDSYLFSMDGISLSGFLDYGSWFLKVQANLPFSFNEARGEALIRFNPSGAFMAELFGSYGFSFSGFENNSLFVYGCMSVCPQFFPDWLKSVYLTGEFSADSTMTMDDIMISSGLKFDFGNPVENFFYFKPFAFASGNNFSSLKFGSGAEMQTSWNIAHFGFGEYATVRYSAESKLYASDFYRAKKNDRKNNLVASSGTELYFFTPGTGFNFGEFLIFQQLKVGAFFDYAWTGENSFCAGAFIRSDVSLIGLADFILEAGGGYDISENRPFGYFQMKNRM